MTADDGRRTGRMLKRKVDPASGRWRVVAQWPVTHLGVDEHGTWVGTRRGAAVVRHDGSTVAQSLDLVWLLPPAAAWVACFGDDPDTVATVDVALPPTRQGEGWAFDDLELDLWLAPGGEAGIVDQEELDAVAGFLGPEVVALAVETADALLPLLQRRAEPFGTASVRWREVLRPRQDGGPGSTTPPSASADASSETHRAPQEVQTASGHGAPGTPSTTQPPSTTSPRSAAPTTSAVG